MATHGEIIEYALKKRGTALRYPFDPELPVLFVGSRMFALLGHTDGRQSVNLKGDPEHNWALRSEFPGAILPGYHMNKRHWNTVILDGRVPDSLVYQMVDESYLLVMRNLTRAERERIRADSRRGSEGDQAAQTRKEDDKRAGDGEQPFRTRS